MSKLLRQEVEFIEEWMGNPVGSKKTILIDWAKELEKRKTVKFVEVEKEKDKEKEKEKEKEEENMTEKEDSKIKMVEKAVSDKMFKGSKNK